METEEEIRKVAKLMRIELDDHGDHLGRVKKMLEYFEILDRADVASEELDPRVISSDSLRDDAYQKSECDVAGAVRMHDSAHIRAPRMP